VRGKGLLIGMEFPTDEMGWKVASGMFTRRVLTAGTFINAKTIRIEPALNISYELIDEMLRRLEDVFSDISGVAVDAPCDIPADSKNVASYC